MKLHHTCVRTQSIEQSLLFYKDILGMQLVDFSETEERTLALLACENQTHIELLYKSEFEKESIKNIQAIHHFAFEVEDLEAYYEKLGAHQISFSVKDKVAELEHCNVKVAFFEGPNGELIELLKTLP